MQLHPRLAGFLCCLTLLAAGQICAQTTQPAKKPTKDTAKKADAPKPEPEPVKTWPVLGRGRNKDEAEKDALERARQIVVKFLQRQDPPFQWAPSVEFVKSYLFFGAGKRQEKEDIDIVNELEKVKMLCWEWTVQIPQAQLQSMQREDTDFRAELARKERLERAVERMWGLARFTGWAVLALAGVGLYLRLDQWTAGSHRGWLRLALASLLFSSGIGWWLLS
jgi:hypothetical protein